MAETVIDTFITRFLFKTDKGALRGLENRIGSIRNKLNGVSRGFTIAGAAVTGTLIGLSRPLDEYSKAINRVKRDLDPSDFDMSRLENQMVAIGNNARYASVSLQDVAAAQNQLGKAGVSIDDILKMTPQVMDLSIATEISPSEAASQAASLMQIYKIAVEDMESVFDRLAWQAVNANTTVQETLDFLIRTGPVARTLDYDIYELIAAYGQLGTMGFDPSRAETGLRQFMIQLERADQWTEDAIQGFSEKGISLDDLFAAKDRGFIGVLQYLKDAGLGVRELSLAFGTEAAPQIVAAMEEIAKIRAEQIRGEKEAAGQAARQRDAMSEGWSGALAALRSAKDTAIVQLGEGGLNDVLKGYANNLRALIDMFMGLDRETKGYIATAIGLGPVLLGIGAALKTVSWALGGLMIILKAPALALGALGLLLAGTLLGFDKLKAGIEGTVIGDLWDEFEDKARAAWSRIGRLFKEHTGRDLDLADPDFWRFIRDTALAYLSDMFWRVDDVLNGMADRVESVLESITPDQIRAFAEEARVIIASLVSWTVEALKAIDWNAVANSWLSGQWMERIAVAMVQAMVQAIRAIDWWSLIWDGDANPSGDPVRRGMFGRPVDPGELEAALDADRAGTPWYRSPRADPMRAAGFPAAPGWLQYGPGEEDNLARLWSNLTTFPAPPPVLPAPVMASGQYGPPPPPSRQTTVNIDRVEIIVPDGDKETLKQVAHEELEAVFRDAVENADTDTDR